MTTKVLDKNLSGFTGEAWLVEIDNYHFVISGTFALFSGWECLVFPADKNGKVISWGDVAGGRGITNKEALEDLEKRIEQVGAKNVFEGNFWDIISGDEDDD